MYDSHDNPDDLSLELAEVAAALVLAVEGRSHWDDTYEGAPGEWAGDGLKWLAWEVHRRSQRLSEMHREAIDAKIQARRAKEAA